MSDACLMNVSGHSPRSSVSRRVGNSKMLSVSGSISPTLGRTKNPLLAPAFQLATFGSAPLKWRVNRRARHCARARLGVYLGGVVLFSRLDICVPRARKKVPSCCKG